MFARATANYPDLIPHFLKRKVRSKAHTKRKNKKKKKKKKKKNKNKNKKNKKNKKKEGMSSSSGAAGKGGKSGLSNADFMKLVQSTPRQSATSNQCV